jgi:hypothetical protein
MVTYVAPRVFKFSGYRRRGGDLGLEICDLFIRTLFNDALIPVAARSEA